MPKVTVEIAAVHNTVLLTACETYLMGFVNGLLGPHDGARLKVRVVRIDEYVAELSYEGPKDLADRVIDALDAHADADIDELIEGSSAA